MKKNLCAALALVAMLAACNDAETTIKTKDSITHVTDTLTVGSDKDAHGCVGSAGYVWSTLKNNCIRTFEVANVKLMPAKDTASYTATANLIFNADTTKVEVFLPSQKESVVLDRSGLAGSYVWKKDSFEMSSGKGYALKSKGMLIFESK